MDSVLDAGSSLPLTGLFLVPTRGQPQGHPAPRKPHPQADQAQLRRLPAARRHLGLLTRRRSRSLPCHPGGEYRVSSHRKGPGPSPRRGGFSGRGSPVAGLLLGGVPGPQTPWAINVAPLHALEADPPVLGDTARGSPVKTPPPASRDKPR